MNRLRSAISHNRNLILVILLCAIGCFLRILSFGEIPCGFNQDEAFAGYEAFSLLHYGIDSSGYVNPTYFISWGSGMNVLESYLAIPFIWLFGCTVTAFRLPMLICSCVSLPVFYLLLKEVFGKKIAFVGLAVLSVCPWHIMLSHWGLESNLAPAFLLYGLYFLIKGIKNNRFWLLAALMYGISLYSYAITWAVVPATLAVIFIYMLICQHRFSVRYLIGSVVILFLLALPHILFMLINMNVIPEITTDFISIPRLVAMRDSEISLKNLLSAENYYHALKLVFGGGDDLIWNSLKQYGMYYIISIPFVFVGVLALARSVLQKFRKRHFDGEAVILLGSICSFFVAVIVSGINVNKANHMHLYTVMIIALGIDKAIRFFGRHKKMIAVGLAAAYALLTVLFSITYFGSYNTLVSYDFREGVEACVRFVNAKGFESVQVDSSIYYPQILFFDQTPTPEYLSTKNFVNYPCAFLDVSSFGKYRFGIDYSAPEDSQAYIVPTAATANFTEEKYGVINQGNYSVVYIK